MDSTGAGELERIDPVENRTLSQLGVHGLARGQESCHSELAATQLYPAEFLQAGVMTSVLCISPYEEIGSFGDLPGPDGLILLDGQLVNLEAYLQDRRLTGRRVKERRNEMGDGRRFRLCMAS